MFEVVIPNIIPNTLPHRIIRLSQYQVDDDLKVTRSRKDCPHETCGAGVRMAVHKDRLHCGKCSLTFLLDGENA